MALPCEASSELEDSRCVLLAPLRLEGLREKKSAPSIGWEVTVKSQLLENGRRKGCQSPRIVIKPIIFSPIRLRYLPLLLVNHPLLNQKFIYGYSID